MVLLARGALVVNFQAIRRLGRVVPLLGFMPFFAAAAVFTALALFVLEMPVAWATLIG